MTNKAVIPVASLCTRILSAAKAILEELLLVGMHDAVVREYVRHLSTMKAFMIVKVCMIMKIHL